MINENTNTNMNMNMNMQEEARVKRRTKEREGVAEGSRDCWKIGVAGLTRGAGASLITACLAAYLSDMGRYTVAVCELGTGGLYSSLDMGRRFALREYHSFYKAAEGEVKLRSLKNREEEINWALKRPEERDQQLSYKAALRLIYGISGDVVLFDFSGRNDEEGWWLLREMDAVLVAIDPLPSKLLAGHSRLERWKLSALPVSYIINKDNRGVGRRELDRFLHLKQAERIPFLPPEQLYAAEYHGINPYRMEGIEEIVRPAFDRWAKNIPGLI